MAAYNKIQFTQENPSALWVITHNFTSNINIDVNVLAEGVTQKILPLSTTYVNSTTIHIELSSPLSGNAILIGTVGLV